MAGVGVDFYFDAGTLLPLGEELHEAYVSAEPCPHVVIDDLFPEETLQGILDEFPEPEAVPWQQFESANERKLALADPSAMGPNTRHLLAEFNSHVFVEFLERLTGIDGLIPDPHYVGGGLHQIRTGGYLKIHADFNQHERLRLDRRLNALLYLNRDWPEEYGGHLELWDREMKGCVQRYLPRFNRLVIFSTTDFSYHGHPDPLTCPPTRARRSMALYYYSNGRPAYEVSSDHTTLFKGRPGESVARPSARETAKRWLPPVVTDVLRSAKSRRQPPTAD